MIHLDAKTGYSFLRGYGLPEAWLERAQSIGARAFGLADYCSTWGHVPFMKSFTASGIKLLYGVQLPVTITLDKDPRHGLVTLIAKNDKGLTALYEAVALAHEQTYYRPRLKWSQLAELRGKCELIVNECSLGDLIDFGRLGFGYIGVAPKQSHMLRVLDEFDCVATGAPVYPTFQDRQGFNLVQAISDRQRIGEVNHSGFHMLRQGEYEATLRGFEIEPKKIWFDNAKKIAEECNAEIPQASLVETTGDLRKLAVAGARRRNIRLRGDYKERLDHELTIIRNKNFDSYFLFVADLVSWAKKRMFVGPARGSSGGSLLCYLLGITEVDPLRFGTLFERFLDPTRNDLPDIDVDFPDDMRDYVFEYLSDKYGAEHVARLGTVSKLGGKSAINDVVRAYGIPYSVGRDFCKTFDFYDLKLEPFFEHCITNELKPLLETYPDIAKAQLLEGTPRHTGVHAAGVCITKEPISKYGVVDRAGIISLDMDSAESIGMLKMDALGLRTLSVLADACKQIKMDYLDLYDLSYDDPAVFAVFNKDLVTGVFQFEGKAVRGLMKSMEVDKFDDLCALVSLARPGPLVGGAAENYVQRRAALVDWDYAHPALEAHTKETFGTIVYQEQAMGIVRDIGGFDVGEVNAFRKAVGKKDPEKLATFREKFLYGASKVMGEEISNDIWDEMCEFGSYAFNKSHAVAYAMVSYMCAWFKANHPVEFAVAQLRNAADEDQGKALLRELETEGHEFIPFDPMRSRVQWHVEDGTLIGGFTSVKGIGKKTAEKMIEIRDHHGEDWMATLTEAQRRKLTMDFNTPWHDLNRFAKLYWQIYENPLDYRSEALDRGAKGPILRINEIPDEKGTYTFLARLTRRQPRTKTNDKGEIIGEFCNLYFEDDTGTVGCTINQFKWGKFKWLMEDNYDGEDWIVKGNVINDGRLWLFIENLIQLGPDDRRKKDDESIKD